MAYLKVRAVVGNDSFNEKLKDFLDDNCMSGVYGKTKEDALHKVEQVKEKVRQFVQQEADFYLDELRFVIKDDSEEEYDRYWEQEFYSPSPVYKVRPVQIEKIRANAYNPNSVAPPEMKLLELSIWEDGYTMPIVCYYLPETDEYEIVDGYHRYTTMLTSKRIYEREGGKLPVVVIDKPLQNRMASTIRHNRARGTHSIDLMKNIVAQLVEAGMGDDWIRKHIGMDEDELLRLKQITGIASLFQHNDFNQAWVANPDEIDEMEK